ncbi:hypothetical protein E4J89_15445 [Arthrobacter sp. CAU 1506]|uniref:hypothetical protein n=1 Tax=Arthrobacter sp. CAU 1506 TaxID=2560052 RepID=UPI0010AB699D|nr:hypothetical protein [Arthrobacter sp. CAU 1506]TJY67284.1 hypothetical protein E4J89_15445 [Arthrobacter sp. CAU 1506]
MSGKLKVTVRVDLECSSVHIDVRGRVDERNVLAVYSLAQRANSLAPGLEVAIDLQHASVDAAVLWHLQACAVSGFLPEYADPLQAECRLTILAPEPQGERADVVLAA